MPDSESRMRMRAYSRDYMRRREREGREHINRAKDRPCADCGVRYESHVMTFDHRPGEGKLFSIGARAGRSISVLDAEIAKCDVVCANCHAARTHAWRARDSQPG